MEIKHHVEGSFGSEFRAICNHCVVIAAWSRKKLKFCEKVLLFWKTTLYGNIFKILFRQFLLGHRSTLLCSNFVKFVRRKIDEIVIYLTKKFRLPLKLTTARIAPKICQGQPLTMYSECSSFRCNIVTLSGLWEWTRNPFGIPNCESNQCKLRMLIVVVLSLVLSRLYYDRFMISNHRMLMTWLLVVGLRTG